MDPKTNLVKAKGTRRHPENGDIFYMRLPTGNYLFGRVRFAEASREKAPMPGATLIYIYSWQSPTPQPDYTMLRRDRLLIPPLWTNRMSWTKGYFQHVENRAGDDRIIFGPSCFHDKFRDRYVNEHGNRVSGRAEPCGSWALVSYRGIDDRVSDAVGIVRVPMEPGDR